MFLFASTKDQMKTFTVSRIPIVESHSVFPHVISGHKQVPVELDKTSPLELL